MSITTEKIRAKANLDVMNYVVHYRDDIIEKMRQIIVKYNDEVHWSELETHQVWSTDAPLPIEIQEAIADSVFSRSEPKGSHPCLGPTALSDSQSIRSESLIARSHQLYPNGSSYADLQDELRLEHEGRFKLEEDAKFRQQ